MSSTFNINETSDYRESKKKKILFFKNARNTLVELRHFIFVILICKRTKHVLLDSNQAALMCSQKKKN